LSGKVPPDFPFRPCFGADGSVVEGRFCGAWGMNNDFNYRWDDPVQIRNCPDLNNVVEQDHRRVKSRVAPMLGFKRFFNARRVLSGVQLVQKIIKGQFGLPESFGADPFQVRYNVLAA
jgi:transposase-like protein